MRPPLFLMGASCQKRVAALSGNDKDAVMLCTHKKTIGRNERGFTLYEMTIVIAVLAIICAMVISLSAFISRTTENTRRRNETQEELMNVRLFAENWFYSFDHNDYELSLDGKSSLCFQKGGDKFSLKKSYNEIIAEYPDGGTTLSLTYVTSLEFGHLDGSGLYRCNLKYNDGEVYTFMLRCKKYN